jgi:hypothetical protein
MLHKPSVNIADEKAKERSAKSVALIILWLLENNKRTYVYVKCEGGWVGHKCIENMCYMRKSLRKCKAVIERTECKYKLTAKMKKGGTSIEWK